MKDTTEQQNLIENCLFGCKRSQKILFENNIQMVFSTCYKYLQNKELAEDATSIAFTKIFGNLQKYNSDLASFSTWINRIAINESLQLLRGNKILRNSSPIEELLYVISDEEWDTNRISKSEIIPSVEALNSPMREVFKLFVLEDLSHGEIAEILHITEGYSRVCLSKAKKLLAEKLTKKKIVVKI